MKVLDKRLDQGHLHPKPEVRKLSAGNKARVSAVGGEHSRKEFLEQLILSLFGTSTWLPQCMTLTHPARSKSSYVGLSG